MEPPADLDASRAAVAERGLIVTASGYLTEEVASALPFEALAAFKDHLKRYFSPLPWTAADADALSDLVAPHVDAGWWEHDLGGGLTMRHGIDGSGYVLWVDGASQRAPSIFDRAFSGPVVPEPTPHPRKVKFAFGGAPSPGRWHRRGDPDPPADARISRLLDEPDVTDVMVAGDFVTIGIGARSSWELRLEPLLALVTDLFAGDTSAIAGPERTRDELLHEAGHAEALDREELHLLDPNDAGHVTRLRAALDDDDARTRRIAVALLAESDDPRVRIGAVERGYGDRSRLVRRTAIDAAADAEDEGLRPLLERTLRDGDDWIRWRAIRALGVLGLAASRPAVEAMTSDPEFRVRFEAERVLRAGAEAT
jgi:hypothetical protein